MSSLALNLSCSTEELDLASYRLSFQRSQDYIRVPACLNCSAPGRPSEFVFTQSLNFPFASQVVCVRSTWNALSPRLSCDTRPLILKALSELFSLVPSLAVNTAEYEVCL